MKQLLAKLKAAASWTKRELLRVEVVVRSAAAAAFAGGLHAAYAIYSSGKHFELSAAHLLALKNEFISGAFVGVLMFLIRPPKSKAANQDANSAA
jgi:hypothetical protein